MRSRPAPVASTAMQLRRFMGLSCCCIPSAGPGCSYDLFNSAHDIFNLSKQECTKLNQCIPVKKAKIILTA